MANAPKKAPVLKFPSTSEEITKLVKSIQGRAKTLDHDTHRAMVGVIHHAHTHGDVTVAQKLIDLLMAALGRSQRKDALIKYAIEFGPFEPAEDGKNVVYSKARRLLEEEDIKAAVGKAAGISPWDFTPPPPFKPVDLDDLLAKLAARATAAANGDDADKHKIDPEKLAKLQALVGETAA